MAAKHPDPRLPDKGILASHAHRVGDSGSGKECSPQQAHQDCAMNAPAQSLLDSLGLSNGDAPGCTYFQSISPETLAAFYAKFRGIRSFADLTRYADEPSRSTGNDGSGNTDPPR